MRYRNNRSNKPRTITVKFAGQCACCGATIAAGEIADYYPAGSIASITTGSISHMGGLDGNSARCAAEIKRRNNDPSFVDLDRAYEDQCSDICGR